ncbi:hypothetical protein [Thermococcus sp. GR6]|nr:hypothetical protein [Thermococcus sp. GR6]
MKPTMTCPAVVGLGGSAQCTIHFKLEEQTALTLNLERLEFGGKMI